MEGGGQGVGVGEVGVRWGWGWGGGADRLVIGSTVLSLVRQNTELCISAVAADNVTDSVFQGRVTEFIHAGKTVGISFFNTI